MYILCMHVSCYLWGEINDDDVTMMTTDDDPPVICLFRLSFYCWTSRLPCCWCSHMERFTFGRYLLTVAVYI